MSDYGKGIVVPLAKFSEHLRAHGPYSEEDILSFAEGRQVEGLMPLIVKTQGSRVQAVSHAIEMWMNAASDHFYDLDARAPQPLKELAALTLRIGHGFTGETWTVEHIRKIRELWEQSCLAVDEMLGVETDWGSW